MYEYGSGNCVGLYEIAKVASPSHQRMFESGKEYSENQKPAESFKISRDFPAGFKNASQGLRLSFALKRKLTF